jgi:hypothetical protein
MRACEMDEATYLRASDAVRRLQVDLDVIAEADPESEARRRAITRYSATFAELGRYRVDVPWMVG